MTTVSRRIAVLGALFGAIIITGARALSAAEQIPTTCEAVGCFGGKPGCYWYNIPSGTVMCYGIRP